MSTKQLAKEMNVSVRDTSSLIINFIFYAHEQNVLINFKSLSKNEKSIIFQEYVAKCINQLEEFESSYMNVDITELFDGLVTGVIPNK